MEFVIAIVGYVGAGIAFGAATEALSDNTTAGVCVGVGFILYFVGKAAAKSL